MFTIKKIIRDQLAFVLESLHEVEVQTAPNYKTQIIYNYEIGRAFGENSLATDIVHLNEYYLSEYLPKNENEEEWQYEFETVHDSMMLVDISRKFENGVSYWTLKIGQLLRGEKNQLPTLIADLNNVPGYDNFVNMVNNTYASKIDPSKY
jgi:hypothetical protein